MHVLSVTIPGAPVGKGRPRVFRNHGITRAVTPAKTVAWETFARWHLTQAHQGETLTGPVRVEVVAVNARPKRLHRKMDPDGLLWRTTKPDADNVGKAVCDALERSGIIRNDSQVCQLLIESRFAERDGGPRVEVTVSLVVGP